MKKIVYLFLIAAASVTMFFAFNIQKYILASPGLTGSTIASKETVNIGESFTISVSGYTDSGRDMLGLRLFSETTNEYFYFDCVKNTERTFTFANNLSPTDPNTAYGWSFANWSRGTLSQQCSHSWTFNTSDKPLSSKNYSFRGYAYDFADNQYTRQNRNHTGEASPRASQTNQITVSVGGVATLLPSANICEIEFTKDGVSQTGTRWCKNTNCSTPQFTFCSKNTFYVVKCQEKTFWGCGGCDSSTSKSQPNDNINCPNPGATSLISPINGIQVSETLTLQWNGVANLQDSKIANYEWLINEAVLDEFYGHISGLKKDSGFVGSSQPSVTISPQLENNKYYLWTVRAITEDGRKGLWAPYGLFRGPVLAGAPPAGGAVPAPGSTGVVGRNCPLPMTIENPSIYKAGNTVVAYDGLVPCGKCVIKDGTKTGETISGTGVYSSCQFCHFFVMFYGIVDFLIWKITLPMAILLMVIGGAMFVFSAGQPKSIQKGKSIITSIVIGLVIIFVAYLVVGAFLSFIGLADWTWQIYKDWSRGFFQFNCPINI